MALIPFGATVGILIVTSLVSLQSIFLGLKVLGVAVIVQQIVDNLVAPRVLGSVIGLNPVWVFISVLAGAKVWGLLGVVIAVPTAAVLKTALMSVRSQIVVNPSSSQPEAPLEKSIEVVTTS